MELIRTYYVLGNLAYLTVFRRDELRRDGSAEDIVEHLALLFSLGCDI